jgi:beta-lactamase regulating signal transducer with metallopeptidase domain
MIAASSLWSPAARELCNHLWQSTLFAFFIAFLVIALRKHPARARYWLWMTASAKFLIPFSLLIAAGTHLARPTPTTLAQTSAYVLLDKMSQPFTGASNLQPSIPIAPQRTRTPTPTPTRPTPTHHTLPLAIVLAALWLCGLIAILTRWLIQWSRIAIAIRNTTPLREGRVVETLRSIEQLAHIPHPIAVLSTPGSMEPGVFGILRPVLLWPEAISPHLDDAHLEAVLAHEAAHVRRRDNLTSLLHMLVEAIFWFHPLVWWMESQLVKERERACDEEVLLLCQQPQAYAESILKVCELCIESPLTCVSGITGADLKRRIVQIMTASIVSKLGLGARLLLLSAAIVAVAVPFMLGQMKGARVLATVKAAAHIEANAMSLAAHVWSPIEPESSTPSNTLIASSPAPEYQIEPVKLTEGEAAPAQTTKRSPHNPDVSRATVQQSLGFEDQSSTALTGWFTNPAATVSADDRIVHAGHWSVRLQPDAESRASVITRSTPVDFQGHVIELRGYLRLQDVSEFAGLWLRQDNGDQTVELENMSSQQVKGTRDWAQYRITLPINPRAQSLHFGVLVSGTGTLWADDLELLVDGKPIAEAPNKQPLTNADIIDMSRAGVPESTILLAIQNTSVKFDVSAQGILALHAAGITEPVLNQMLRAATPQKQTGPGFGVATGSFPVADAAGETVRFSAWIKTENVQNGYAGLWWRVDGPGGEYNHVALAFDNSQARFIDGKPEASENTLRGATGTTPWTHYEFELPVDKTAANVYFGVLFTGTGTAWVDAMKIELDGQPYSNPKFDFDFESPKPKGFYTGCGGNGGGCDYKVGIDDTVSYSGRQSLKMQSLADAATQK